MTKREMKLEYERLKSKRSSARLTWEDERMLHKLGRMLDEESTERWTDAPAADHPSEIHPSEPTRWTKRDKAFAID